ncbi:hypothetical protein HHL21_20620 [Massilia sp. RP-1-19]|uniref:DUF2946 domain-containing protein n=1 Tax=Massilia polaris TaxID=2728846 RepID=A0A848HTN9_9BURK|nr:hypothetical protein [Massilia polaris]NML63450.1 hypothetical protein [Massilia polaris]
MRRLICIALLMCLPLQSFALQVGALLSGGGANMAHQIEHDNHVQHHHDGDGSVHYDDSDESAQHAQDHTCSPQPADLSVPKLPSAPEQLVSVLKAEFSRFIPDPYLDDPLRPPSPAPGQTAEGSIRT